VKSSNFDRDMKALLDTWCDRRALQQLRIVLPHYPMPNGFTDEIRRLVVALKTVRAQTGATLPAAELDQVIELLHAAEEALEKVPANFQA
jgi:predicted DNA-binding transcriptional regulator YafY